MDGGGEIQLQVAFAGHRRAGDMGDADALEQKLARICAMLKAAGSRRARLLTGLADGADEIAAKVWRDEAMGPIHAILPFLHEGHSEVGPERAARTGTWLDGERLQKAGGSPHLAQTRWLLGGADLLIAVWTGRPKRGLGGTADAIRLAVEDGIPVLWINPRDETPRLIPPLPMHRREDMVEMIQSLPGSRAAATARADPSVLGRILDLETPQLSEAWTRGRFDAWLGGWLWRTFALFQRVVGGRPVSTPTHPVPADLASQPGFAVITSAYLAADNRADKLAGVHRSEQILLLMAAVAAAAIGATPVFWPWFKFEAAIGELTVGLFAFAVWWAAQRSRHHEGWTQARRLAEQLRLNRAGWALGVSTRGAGSPSMRHEHIALARPILRQAQPPTGDYDARRVAAWTPWAMAELVAGQADYHERQGSRNRRISRRVQRAADAGFVTVVIGLVATAALSAAPASARAWAPPWLAPAAIAAGVIVPAIAAACMALEARLQFEEQAERSAQLVDRLRRLEAEVDARPQLEAAQGAFRAAAEWLLAEADQWREGSVRRRLSRGG